MKGATKNPIVYWTTPPTKNHLAQNVNRAETEKPWSSLKFKEEHKTISLKAGLGEL